MGRSSELVFSDQASSRSRILTTPPCRRRCFWIEWFGGEGRERLPADRERLLLKPLYSFAGKGIQFAPTDEDLRAIPAEERSLYLLQERVNFEPVIQTPQGQPRRRSASCMSGRTAESMKPVTSLVGMGVD